ncbi:type I toxin-antitoxin system Fst family toxin [Lactococcus lactis]|nr:type I toxin-antitoxin system Fst family toxin [Lactococcus lactis]MCT0054827.1 type I toxin-antitoxin system Fst family toxin [Lactococcus lactis subsp. lactis]
MWYSYESYYSGALLQIFVSVVAPTVVGVILELVKDWLKYRHKRH